MNHILQLVLLIIS